MKKLLIGIGALVVLLIAAVIIIPLVVPVAAFKDEILASVKESTGRDMKIEGDFDLSILPSVEFVAGKVSLSNAPGGKAEQMVTLDQMSVKVALFPLLSGNLEIDSFVLNKPVINLEVDKNGKPNWEFKPAAKPGDSDKPAGGSSGGDSDGGGNPLSGLKLGDVRLVDGLVTYSDAQKGVSHRIEDIDMTVSLPSMSSPMNAEGGLTWNKERVNLTLGMSNPNAYLGGGTTDVKAALDIALLKLGFDGKAGGGKTATANGKIDLDVPNIRKLAEWTGNPIDAPGTGLGPLKITGTLNMAGSRIGFNQAKIKLDEMNADGDFTFDGGGAKPNIVAALAIDKLDMNPYLPPEAPKGQAPAGGASGGTAGGGKAGPSDWSDDPIDMSGLKAANADLKLTVGGLIVRKIKVGKSALRVTLKDGLLVTNLSEMALYDGGGTAKITADARQKTPAITANLALKGFQAEPFLTDAAELEWLSGTANADLQVRTTGGTQRQLVQRLNGDGKVQFLDGAIRGVNLGAMVRNVATAFLDSDAGKTQKTDFAELGGTFKITNGILNNNDLALKSPLLRLAGKGTVDMPKRTVNYRVEPKLVATTQGQGGTAAAPGIKVPVIVSGPWHDISYKPDLAGAIGGIAKDPGKALEGIKNLIPGQSGGSPASGGSTGGAAKPAIPDPGKTLKKLFGN